LATATNGADIYFFNINGVSLGKSKSITLYSGSQVASYTNYDYSTQSCQLPYTVDPRTISFYEQATGTGVITKWTRVDKGTTSTTNNNKTFTVINGPEGYIVTNNFQTSTTIPTSSTVLIKAIISNGDEGSSATIAARSDFTFATFGQPFGGYDLITVEQARYRLLFNATGQDRCVTINDYINAILSSGISGTSDESLITVQNDCCVPGRVKVYVQNLSTSNQNLLMEYLSTKILAGINLVYEQ
jgi:hypothetical protein